VYQFHHARMGQLHNTRNCICKRDLKEKHTSFLGLFWYCVNFILIQAKNNFFEGIFFKKRG
ncbi:MAG TPA: hypothetical protein DDX01_08885, partial [Holosporales bacterium]|nr:hypothetical protein [Holosporales bacterium]